MANPIVFSVLPDCGFDIDVNFRDDGGTFDHSTAKMDPTDIDTMRSYTIRNLDDVEGLPDYEHSENHTTGLMSPMDYVNLPTYQRAKAAIPKDAEFFAFLHPPPDLSDVIGDYREIYEMMARAAGKKDLRPSTSVSNNRSSFNLFNRGSSGKSGIWKNRRKVDTDESVVIGKVPAALFAAFGGFVYFSGDRKVLRINVYSPMIASKYQIRMAGPYGATDNASKTIIDVGRFQSSKLETRHECSFIAVGWVRPRETFRGQPLTSRKHNDDGAFIFYKDNGEAVAYVLDENEQDLNEFKYERGEFEFMADSAASMSLTSDFKGLFSRRMPKIDFDECRQRVNLALKDIQHDDDIDSINLENLSRSDDSGNYPILHQALKCNFDLASVKKIVDKYGEVWNKDDYGWEALHYGCRFYADNVQMIKYILQNSSPGAVHRKDSVGRYPLHIACDSNPSVEVIQLLLSEEIAGKSVILKETKHLHLLPLHIACNAAAERAVIRLLLDADKKGQTIRARTKAGRMPLHIALLNRMSTEVIELLLDADTNLVSDSSSQGLQLTDENSLYQWDHGMLPLHMACLCGRDTRTVKLLLDRDTRGRTLFQQLKKKPLKKNETSAPRMESRLPTATNGVRDHNSMKKRTAKFDERTANSRFLSIDSDYLSGCRALHLSLLRKSAEISRLLLQTEKNISHQQKTSSSKRQERALMKFEFCNRTCLHLACANNDEFDIIRLLLTLDPTRKSTKMPDKDGCTPLHKACNNKFARVDVIRELLKTESPEEKKKYNFAETVLNAGRPSKSMESVHEEEVKQPSKYLDIFGMNPLSLAVKAKAPPEVIELLLHPDYLDVNGFDDRTICELAKRIKNSVSLQSTLTLAMAQRTSFLILMMQLFVYTTALIVSLYGTNRRYLDERPTSDPWVVVVMSGCAILFVVREITQIFSEKLNYLFDMANIFELSNMVLFNMSIYYFNTDGLIDKEDRRIQGVLIASTFLLIINIIFFLRSTILPFSRFAGGLINIAYTMIPFFLVSALLLLGFTYSYRITYDDAIFEEDGADRMLKKKIGTGGSIASKCNESLGLCFMGVLSAFLSGGTEELNDYNDVFFGLIIVLVVLNVVIAIVSDAWDTAKDEATDLYWQGRLNFLLEMRSIIRFLESQEAPAILKKLDEIPSVMGKGAIANISWTRDYPYHLVDTKAEYDNPKEFFSPEIADVILNAKSPANDLRWLALDDKEHRIAQVKVSIKWAGIYILDFFLIIIGFATFGLLWSEQKRVWLLSFANLPEEEDDIDETELELVREELAEKEQIIKELEEEIEKWKKEAIWD